MKLNKSRGIVMIIISAFFFALMNVFVHLSGELPVMQKAFFRNAVCLIVAIISMLKNKTSFFPSDTKNLKYLISRTLFGSVGVICNYYCVDHLIVSDASILNKLSPFFAIVFSFLILKEKPKIYQWILVSIAFVGAMFVVKPSFSSLDMIPGFIGVLGGACAGMAYTFVRKLGQKGEKSIYIVFFFSFFSTLMFLPGTIIFYENMNLSQWLSLIAAGVCATVGQLCITNAYVYAPAKDISIYDYTQVIFASVLGYLFFMQVPDILSILGYVVIVSMAVINYILQKRK